MRLRDRFKERITNFLEEWGIIESEIEGDYIKPEAIDDCIDHAGIYWIRRHRDGKKCFLVCEDDMQRLLDDPESKAHERAYRDRDMMSNGKP